MLACVACSKHVQDTVDAIEDDQFPKSPAIKSLTAQLKDLALRYSAGAYRHCRPCINVHQREGGSCVESMDIMDTSSETSASNIHHLGGFFSTPPQSFSGRGLGGLKFGNETKHGTRKVSSRTGAPNQSALNVDHFSGGTVSGEGAGDETAAEDEADNEWVAQVEPGVLITLVPLSDGGNELKRIRFSRNMFNKWQAQQWWAENCEKVHELYNVALSNRPTGSLPMPLRSEDEFKDSPRRDIRMASADDSPQTPCNVHEYVPNGVYHPDISSLNLNRSYLSESNPQPIGGTSKGLSGDLNSRECIAQSPFEGLMQASRTSSSCQVTSTTSDLDVERPDDLHSSGDLVSTSNVSEQEMEWVEEDEPGVYITFRSLAGGIKELKRVRFSREKFTEFQARLWWEENRLRIHGHYL